jgi:hypothetical protein
MRGRSLLLTGGLLLFACGGENAQGPGAANPPNGAPDGGVVVDDAGNVVLPDGAIVAPDGATIVVPQRDPQVRYVNPNNESIRIDAKTLQPKTVLARTYPGLTRSRGDNPWDLYDPITGRYIAQFAGQGGSFLWSVDGDAPQKVTFDGPQTIFQDTIAWGVMSADGQRIYLSTEGGAYVATRKSAKLEFSALVPVGKNVKIVHDVSADGKRVAVSGHRPIKWNTPTDIACPRMVSVYEVNADGTLGADKTGDYPRLASGYIQEPSFYYDSVTLLYEGDDDLDTGDHLFQLKPGEMEKEIVPQALSAQDFNTPCVLPDDRVAFWESDNHVYTLRLYDPKANKTVSLSQGMAYSGYVRCR